MRFVARAYAVIVVVLAVYAWSVEIALRNSPREHLLGYVVLSLVSLPSGLSISALYDRWPTFFQKPFAELGWLTICAAAQASALLFLAELVSRLRGESATHEA